VKRGEADVSSLGSLTSLAGTKVGRNAQEGEVPTCVMRPSQHDTWSSCTQLSWPAQGGRCPSRTRAVIGLACACTCLRLSTAGASCFRRRSQLPVTVAVLRVTVCDPQSPTTATAGAQGGGTVPYLPGAVQPRTCGVFRDGRTHAHSAAACACACTPYVRRPQCSGAPGVPYRRRAHAVGELHGRGARGAVTYRGPLHSSQVATSAPPPSPDQARWYGPCAFWRTCSRGGGL
jgi:hypothetical protein